MIRKLGVRGRLLFAFVKTIELSRQAERIVAAAPTLLVADTAGERSEASQAIFKQVALLNLLVSDLRGQNDTADAPNLLEPVVRELGVNLVELDRVVALRLAVSRSITPTICAKQKRALSTVSPSHAIRSRATLVSSLDRFSQKLAS